MANEDIRDLLPLYALGALEGEERRRVEAALDADPALERELAEWSAVSESIADGVAPVQPSDVVRARLLKGLPRPGAAERPVGRSAWPGWAAAAALLLIGAWLTWINLELRADVARLTASRDLAVVSASRANLELQEARSDLRRLLLAQSIVGSPATSTVRLAGLESIPASSGRTFVDPETRRAAFFAADLPPAPHAHTYQLWFIADGTPVSGGVFDPDASGAAVVVVDGVAPIDSIQAWAVTIEPTGGVPQPTGEMVLKG